MNTNFIWAILSAAILLFSACTKDEDDSGAPQAPAFRQALVGEWDFTSIRYDDDEYMGILVDASRIRLNAYSGAKGAYRHEIRYSDGEFELIEGEYAVDTVRQEILLYVFHDTKTVQATLSADGRRMTWTGEEEGATVVSQLQKVK
jgi:hypothetical protein